MKTDAYEAIKGRLASREWRLDNLYFIQNASGEVVRFVRNESQHAFWDNAWYLNAILKARQLGFSTLMALLELDTCLFNSNISAGIVDYSLVDAKKKLAKVAFAYQRLPAWLRQRVPTVKDSTTEIAFENGSSIQVGTSHRGGTLQVLHVSEYGKISALAPDKAKEIKTGAFGTVHAGQFIHVESTAEGTGGEFYNLVQEADARQKEGHALSPLDFRLHFFPWHGHHGYRLPADASLPEELIDYFAELKGKHGIELTPEQKAWYAAKRRQVGPDEMLREYPSVPDEAFYGSLEGTYFKQQMSKARLDGRIGIVPYDENKKVNTFWDIGNDTTTIWFHQSDGVRHRLIDYYENAGEQIAHYCKVLQEKQLKRGFTYGRHFGPHDFGVTDWGGDGKTRRDRASALGIEIDIVPRIEDKADAIEEARSFLNACWIDTKHCARGIQCLDNYRKEWDEVRAVWRSKPLHNWASHGADSLMTGAMGFSPEPERRPGADRHRRRSAPPRSAWAV